MRTSDAAAERAVSRMLRYAQGKSGEPTDFHVTGAAAVAEVERKLRSWYGAEYALCVSNATDGLAAIARAAGVRNAEFITTPLTWGGSLAEWLKLGNRIRFAALDPHTLTMDADSIRELVTSRTRAILAVDLFGNPADTRALRAVADEFGLLYVADAAESLGARRDGMPASSLADAWVVSFGLGKTVEAGDGGAILTNDRTLYEKLLWETQHPARQRIELGLALDNEFASNCRMNPWTAIWLAETFDCQLADALGRQAQRLRQLRRIGMADLVMHAASSSAAIVPSFHRTVVAWRKRRDPGELRQALRDAKWLACIEPLPTRPIVEQAAFAAQYARRNSSALQNRWMRLDLTRYFCLEDPRDRQAEGIT